MCPAAAAAAAAMYKVSGYCSDAGRFLGEPFQFNIFPRSPPPLPRPVKWEGSTGEPQNSFAAVYRIMHLTYTRMSPKSDLL